MRLRSNACHGVLHKDLRIRAFVGVPGGGVLFRRPEDEAALDLLAVGEGTGGNGDAMLAAIFKGPFRCAQAFPPLPAETKNGAIVYQNQADFAESTPTTLYVRARSGASELISANVTLLVG